MAPGHHDVADPIRRLDNAVETLWVKNDQLSTGVKGVEQSVAVLSHRMDSLEQTQREQMQSLASLKSELLTNISAGDSAILQTLQRYDANVQDLLKAHHERKGASIATRWLVGVMFTLLSLLFAANLLRGPI